MTGRSKKRLKRISFIIMCIIILFFTVNWYLSYRLEDALKEQLNDKISEMSGGFYTLSFDKLKVSILTGELSIKDIELKPDSAIFNDWQLKDSLPQTYFAIKLGSIEFNGINLIWKLNYKKLDFSLFEIKDPEVWITTTGDGTSAHKKDGNNDNLESKNLYEIVAPHINSLRANEIRILNGSITYSVKDSIDSTIYSLQKVNFHAYGFALDSTSLMDHRLLYCDNFDFMTNKPQTLLSDTRLEINMGSILFDTRDSIVRFDGIHIHPMLDSLKTRQTIQPGNYVDATIGTVVLKGVNVNQSEGLRFFDARSFEILNSDIACVAIKPKEKPSENKDAIESPVEGDPFTLYNIISPVFHRVSVNKIAIQKAKLKYSSTDVHGTDYFYLDEFNFLANNFLIDSVATHRDLFWYSEEYVLEAFRAKGVMATNNYSISVGYFRANTKQRNLQISNVNINPLSIDENKDYIKGSIGVIDLAGFDYNKGIIADSLVISQPHISYFHQNTRKKIHTKPNHQIIDADHDIQTHSYVNFLKIKDIWVRNGNITYRDKRIDQSYAVTDVDLNVTDLSLERLAFSHILENIKYDTFDLKFKGFNSLLPSKDYRLAINQFKISSSYNQISINGFSLIPEKDSLHTKSITYSLTVPHILLDWTKVNLNPSSYLFDINSLTLSSPQIVINKFHNDIRDQDKKDAPQKDLKEIINQFNWVTIASLDLKDASVEYIDQSSPNTLYTCFDNFVVQGIGWHGHNKLQVKGVSITSPQINISNNGAKTKDVDIPNVHTPNSLYPLKGVLDTVAVGSVLVDNIQFEMKTPNQKVENKTERLQLSNFKWISNTLFKVQDFTVSTPKTDLFRTYELDSMVVDTVPKKQRRDFYSSLATYTDSISINNFKISDAQINYAYAIDQKESKQKFTGVASVAIKDYAVNTRRKQMNVSDYELDASNIQFPISNGFYTIELGNLSVTKKNNRLVLDRLHLIPFYPKEEFAYKEPKHKDWFDVSVGNITLDNINVNKYLKDNILDIDSLLVKDVVLQNYKNQNIDIVHRAMPMIYEGLYTLPFRFNIKGTDVSNFSVIYEELSRGARVPGKIFFTEMNGAIPNFTNIPIDSSQFIKLDANGKLMGTGYFTATWAIPASPKNDLFLLDAHLVKFPLTDLNQLITPMAPAEVSSGLLKDLKFNISASSEGGTTDMLFLYNDLGITVFNVKNNDANKLYTLVANKIIKENNPNKPRRKPRKVHTTIIRDKEHSTFNYFWQLLGPAVVGSVGISQRRQNFFKKVADMFYGMQSFVMEQMKYYGNEEDRKIQNTSK